MSSLADVPELVGFFSYSRDDDDDSHGMLSKLRDLIQRELRGQLGRSRQTLRLWQDREAIAPGKVWEGEIKSAIDQAVFFIPIVTPTAVNSRFCQHEFESFLAREHALGRTDLVFPIYYIRVPSLESDAEWRSDPLLSIIGKRQWADWRDLRLLDVGETKVREAVAQFCAEIVESLRRNSVAPQSQPATAEEAKPRTHVAEEHAAEDRAAFQADTDAPRQSETAGKPAAAEPPSPTLLDTAWPVTEQNRDHRSVLFVALGVLAFLAGVTLVDGVVLLFGRTPILLMVQPTIVAVWTVRIAGALWPQKPRSRLLRYALVAAVAVVAFWLMHAGQGDTYYVRSGYMLLATSVLYAGIVSAGNLRLTVPLVLLSVLAFVATGFMRPASFATVVDMDVRLVMAGEILIQGLAFAGVVAWGWASPVSRMIAALVLINLAETLWVGVVRSPDTGLTLLVASVVSAFGVGAFTTRAWKRFAAPSEA
jgi:TIR domain-containing protein